MLRQQHRCEIKIINKLMYATHLRGDKESSTFSNNSNYVWQQKSTSFECQNLAVFSMPYKPWIEINAYSENEINITKSKWKTEFLIKY